MESFSFFNAESYELISKYFKIYFNFSKEMDKFFSLSTENRQLLLNEIILKDSYIYMKQNYEKVFSILKETENSFINFIKHENKETNKIKNYFNLNQQDSTKKIISKIDFNIDFAALSILENSNYVPLYCLNNETYTYKVVTKEAYKEFFMKLYKLNSINSKNVTAEQRAHIILNNFNENIIYMTESFNLQGIYHCQVFNYGKTLSSLLSENNPEGMNEKLCFFFFFQILKGIKYVHNKGIVHRNLNLSDIIHYSYTVKIRNFSYCRFIKYSFQSIESIKNIIKFPPPELDNEKSLSKENWQKVDVFALGVILYQLSFGKDPFEMNQDCKINIETIENVNYDGDQTEQIKCLIKNCLNYKLTERFTVSQIKDSPWFKQREIEFISKYGNNNNYEQIYDNISNEIEDFNNKKNSSIISKRLKSSKF